uniref:Rhodanese domain-containing protein n=1 Tax=viral metagenome TaxID=1070528 RepID=A0A6C0HG18_9ZZZZ
MGNSSSTIIKNINFEDVQYAINDTTSIIINTLEETNQKCLIKGTIAIDKEVAFLNTQLAKDKSIRILIYGMNACDISPVKKYDQLISIGFYNVYIYCGGLFEWLLLQDIYGKELFPITTSIAKESDILNYKGRCYFNVKMLQHF